MATRRVPSVADVGHRPRIAASFEHCAKREEASSPGRHHPGMVGEIISEWVGDIKSERWARSFRNRGRHRAGSAARALRTRCIAAGPRSSSRPANDGWRATNVCWIGYRRPRSCRRGVLHPSVLRTMRRSSIPTSAGRATTIRRSRLCPAPQMASRSECLLKRRVGDLVLLHKGLDLPEHSVAFGTKLYLAADDRTPMLAEMAKADCGKFRCKGGILL